MKIRGAELQQWVDAWPDGGDWYLDADGGEDFNLDTIDPNTLYDTDAMGYLGYQGSGPALAARSIDGSIRAWRKARAFEVVSVVVPKVDRERFKEWCKANGWKLAGKRD